MGYSHYFPEAVATAEVLDDARRIIAASSVPVAGWDGTGTPVLEPGDGIRLNGVDPEDYETFHVRGSDPTNDYGFAGCKTGRRPYDEIVCAILISTMVRNGTGFDSDGAWEDWQAGLALFQSAVRPLTGDELLRLEMILGGMIYKPGAPTDADAL